LEREPEGKSPLGRTKHKWVENIRIVPWKMVRSGVDWTDLAQDRDQWRVLLSTVIYLRVPPNARKSFSSCTTGRLSRSA
jgi:hypothetical protein